MQRTPLEIRQLDTHRQSASPIFIVADDLTGACDSGVAFLTAGRTVRVLLDLAGIDQIVPQPDAVLAITTETRSLTLQQATEQVTRPITLLRGRATDPIFFKKIDSAARGHIGAETIAALDASGAAIALVTPAFPQAGRTVLNGILTIRDAAHQDTTIALRDLFPGVSPTQIAILQTAANPTLEQEIAQAIARNIRILLYDAQTQSDLELLAAAASRLAQPILWTGSAGLARALAATLPRSPQRKSIAPTRTGRTLVFVGTDHPVTTLQISHLEAHPDTPAQAIHQVDWNTTSPNKIRAAFAEASTAVLILTGGETAAFVLRALDASSILLADELEPGIPWGIVEGGLANGCMAVTKSGGFGSHDALVHAFASCKEISNRRSCAPA